ncbi:MAG TPA: DUF6502 family protein [Oligoflexia bacterium]|nr:DUF6502 family protein [Oligoflexia bacterium]
MDQRTKGFLDGLLKNMLRPVARFCLRRSLRLQDLIEAAKAVFLEVAVQEMERQALAVSRSRLSAMTGVHRRDVMRIHDRREPRKFQGDLIGKVVGQWQSDSRFSTRAGKPRALTALGKQSEFAELVRTVSSDLNPYTVLFELERAGAVQRTGKTLKLCAPVFLAKEIQSGFEILSRDVNDMATAIEENCAALHDIQNLHLRTEYDNIAAEALPVVRKWFLHEGSELHRRARTFLSQYDRDINPDVQSAENGVRVVLSAFSLTEKPPAGEHLKQAKNKANTK